MELFFVNFISIGILKVSPSNQRLFKNNEEMIDEKQLNEYGITIGSARAQSPAQLGLALRYNFHYAFFVTNYNCDKLLFQTWRWCFWRFRDSCIFKPARFAGGHEATRFSQWSGSPSYYILSPLQLLFFIANYKFNITSYKNNNSKAKYA